MASKPYYKTIAEHLLEQIRLEPIRPAAGFPAKKN